MTTTSYETRGRIGVQRTDRGDPRPERDRARHPRARPAAGRPAGVELRVPGSVHALGHGIRRPAARPQRAGPRVSDRGVERSRPGPPSSDCRGAAHRSRPWSACIGRRQCVPGWRRPGAIRPLCRGGTEPSAVAVLRAAGTGRPLPAPGRAAPRSLRRLRLRPRLSVRADPASPRRAHPVSAISCSTCPTR